MQIITCIFLVLEQSVRPEIVRHAAERNMALTGDRSVFLFRRPLAAPRSLRSEARGLGVSDHNASSGEFPRTRSASQSLRVAANSRARRGEFIPIRFHPHDFAKSKNPRRFDVSRNSRRARSDPKVSPNDIEMSRPVDFVSCSVDFVSRPVDFWSVLLPSARRTTIDVKQHGNSGYGKNDRNRSAICDQKAAFLDRKTPKNTVLEPSQL